MPVVSNTSPLTNLAIIGRLDLLQRRYGMVRIPVAVEKELSALSHSAAKESLARAHADGWLVVESPPPFSFSLPFSLDVGETEAIALALALKADVLLMDERRGREAARSTGLALGGVIGELLHARKAGWLTNLRVEIKRLREEAHFFVDPKLEQFILSEAGE